MGKPQQTENKLKGKQTVQDIFKPGKSVEVAFDIDSHSPIVRSSIIYECDYQACRMIIAQTEPKILPSMAEKTIDITALVEEEFGIKFRGGITCRILKFINDYKLFKDKVTDAVLLAFSHNWRNVNIRSAYRLEPNDRYLVEAKLNLDGKIYLSGQELKVSNISFTGIGLLVHRKLKHERNKLLDVKTGAKAGIELTLVEKSEENEEIVMTCTITVVRMNPRFNEKMGYLGAKFNRMTTQDEEVLSKFIHDAQMYIIRKSNRL